ncbi:hypothetical protein, partial [Klebsiella aerogenes]|uniref:hypothetical protein n=1 Tax=Klebsiella aerogenes TaxID=548 RepID=UPI00111568A0
MNTPTSWRKSPFESGNKYRVLHDFKALRDNFKVDEVLVYTKDVYSIYDSCTGYLFSDANGATRVWDVYDDDDLDRWAEHFVLLD